MAVYFVYRSSYDNPDCRYVRVFEADTVLDWFRSIWQRVPQDAIADHVCRLIGRKVQFLEDFFTWIKASSALPEQLSDIDHLIRSSDMCESIIGPHHAQWLYRDRDEARAVYFFDDHYRRKHPGETDFLEWNTWPLPDGAADGFAELPVRSMGPKGDWNGTAYCVCLGRWGTLSPVDVLDEIEAGEQQDVRRIEGVRVPDFPRYLFRLIQMLNDPACCEEADAVDSEINDLRMMFEDVLIPQAQGEERVFFDHFAMCPTDDTAWGAYSDWLMDQGKPPATRYLFEHLLRFQAIAARNLKTIEGVKEEVFIGEHVVQIRMPTRDYRIDGGGILYDHWIFFDDLWAVAHPTLAAGILTFVSRWDVLT